MVQPYNVIMPRLISVGLSGALLPILVSPLAAYVYSMVCDIRQNNLALFATDLLIPPIGIVHGLILFFPG